MAKAKKAPAAPAAKKRKRTPAYKSAPRTGTVGDLVSDGFSALVSLGNECREIVDNAAEGLSQTQRIQTFETTADALENLSEPDMLAAAEDIPVSYSEMVPSRKGRGTSRAVQCSNACAQLEAAADALEDWAGMRRAEGGDSGSEAEADEAESIAEACRDALSEAESAEFPGMYG